MNKFQINIDLTLLEYPQSNLEFFSLWAEDE